MYGSERWAVKRKIEQKMNLAEIRMWMSGMTKEHKIRNEYI